MHPAQPGILQIVAFDILDAVQLIRNPGQILLAQLGAAAAQPLRLADETAGEYGQ
ncbi:hypothetical protein D3C81_2269430 [compost metagenome]